ncbi:hypothetical protein GACE_1322 [Geoglobus acetivorans]|uniref:Uncharacterized protein n=2 Tax=Geoglobus acetivorans TaxID=565033 RepID=A0A0A7GEX3_GEOAI|nr:hypothetical protein GACE_1322 [Geoglobus acetivorans]
MERDVAFAAVMIISAVILTWKWLSLYDNVDAVVIFSAFLLTLSLGLLLISMEYRMEKMKEEFESVKRTVAINSADLEEKIEGKMRAYLDSIDDRLDKIERRLYR